MKTSKIKIMFIASISMIILFFLALSVYKEYQERKTILVTSVIDGDTFEIETGEKVRLICINTPEFNETGYEEAKLFLSELVLNKKVRLEKDISDKDSYGRLLRYVYLNDVFVNKEIVQKNLGVIFPYGNDTKRCDEIAVR